MLPRSSPPARTARCAPGFLLSLDCFYVIHLRYRLHVDVFLLSLDCFASDRTEPYLFGEETFYYLLIASNTICLAPPLTSQTFYYLLIASSCWRALWTSGRPLAFYYLLIASWRRPARSRRGRRRCFLLSLDCFVPNHEDERARQVPFYYLLIASWMYASARMSNRSSWPFYYLLIASRSLHTRHGGWVDGFLLSLDCFSYYHFQEARQTSVNLSTIS